MILEYVTDQDDYRINLAALPDLDEEDSDEDSDEAYWMNGRGFSKGSEDERDDSERDDNEGAEDQSDRNEDINDIDHQSSCARRPTNDDDKVDGGPTIYPTIYRPEQVPDLIRDNLGSVARNHNESDVVRRLRLRIHGPCFAGLQP